MVNKFELPKLSYSYDALEPHIDARTMEIHHTKHHQAYINGLNAALENPDAKFLPDTIEKILTNISKVPESIRGAINFHGGGFDNHRIFWTNMKPNGGGEPDGDLADAIKNSFGSFADFKDKFSKATVAIQGSGWGWLVFNPKTKKIEFTF